MVSVVRRFNEFQHICTAPPSENHPLLWLSRQGENVQVAPLLQLFPALAMGNEIAQVPTPGGKKSGWARRRNVPRKLCEKLKSHIVAPAVRSAPPLKERIVFPEVFSVALEMLVAGSEGVFHRHTHLVASAFRVAVPMPRWPA